MHANNGRNPLEDFSLKKAQVVHFSSIAHRVMYLHHISPEPRRKMGKLEQVATTVHCYHRLSQETSRGLVALKT